MHRFGREGCAADVEVLDSPSEACSVLVGVTEEADTVLVAITSEAWTVLVGTTVEDTVTVENTVLLQMSVQDKGFVDMTSEDAILVDTISDAWAVVGTTVEDTVTVENMVLLHTSAQDMGFVEMTSGDIVLVITVWPQISPEAVTLVGARIDPIMEISSDVAAVDVTVVVATLEDGVTTVTLGQSSSPTPLVHSGSATRNAWK